jgi:hypothetical protein
MRPGDTALLLPTRRAAVQAIDSVRISFLFFLAAADAARPRHLPRGPMNAFSHGCMVRFSLPSLWALGRIR